MFITIKKRLELLIETQRMITNDEIVFDPDLANFGFKRMEQLFPVVQDEIKGYPCVAYHKYSDPIKFGIKVIPLELKYENDTHPCRIELALLKEFTDLVTANITPHITFFFKDMSVSNKKKAMTRFPLKSLRREIFKKSNVLVAEYVPGGSIEEWIQEQPNISEKQWKYIIFSVAWTLLVLQDSYQFMHNDFHYGNILVDSSIDPTDRSIYKYELLSTDDTQDPVVFNIQNVGILPKLWDFEFASTYVPHKRYKNDFFKPTDENIPHEFNPYYDLHCFLTSILELDIPDRLRSFILDMYPEEVIPVVFDDDSSQSSISSRTTCASSCSYERPEEYYRTDESTYDDNSSHESTTCDTTTCTTCDTTTTGYYDEHTYDTHSDRESRKRRKRRKSRSDYTDNTEDTYDTDTEDMDDDSHFEDTEDMTEMTDTEDYTDTEDMTDMTDMTDDEISRRKSRRSRSTASDCRSWTSTESEYRTEFMLGDRMLNGTEKRFDLPTPLDILMSEYFADYRKVFVSKKPTVKKHDCKFTYKLASNKME